MSFSQGLGAIAIDRHCDIEATTADSKSKIFIDLDDTLLDTFTHLVNWHKRPAPYDSISSIIRLCNGGEITREHAMLGMTQHESWESLPLEFWDWIPLMPWAKALIQFCEELAGKENVYILSSQISNAGCVSGKTNMVNYHFPEYRNKLILSRNKHILVDQHSLLIDDHIGHLVKFNKVGKNKNFFLFPSLCNQLYKTNMSMRGIEDSSDSDILIKNSNWNPNSCQLLFHSIRIKFMNLMELSVNND